MNIKRERKANRLVWLGFLMFAVGVLLQGFHSDLGFKIAGGVGTLLGFVGVIFGLDWDDDSIDSFFQRHFRRKPK